MDRSVPKYIARFWIQPRITKNKEVKIYLDPRLKQYPTKTCVFAWAPRPGMTSKKNAVTPAQAGVQCAAGMLEIICYAQTIKCV